VTEPIETLVGRLGRARVLTVGDLMLDEYVWGHVSRISPEAPVPVVEVRGRTHVPGGAANVAAGVVALDGRALLGGVVGADPQAEQLRRALEERGVDCEGVVADPSRSTTTKTRVIAHNQQVVRTDAEERAPLAPELEERVLAWFEGQLGGADAVVLSDYAKGVVSDRLAAGVVGPARERGLPVVVDPKGSDYSKYVGATVLTPNVADAKRAAHVAPDSFVELTEVGRRLAPLLPGSQLLITRGAEGMSLLSEGGIVDVRAEAHAVYDVTGAGDTVVATLAVALGSGLPIEDAVRLANAAAGIVVSKVGTASVTLDELRALTPSASGATPGGPPARRLDQPPVPD
jgi:D-beta-D-heptose 7-phosphate kinase/D-beta-D-heptose 1-phosphate adenosyltransferase